MAIKAPVDFASTVSELEPGTNVVVDGPHGACSIDRARALADGAR